MGICFSFLTFWVPIFLVRDYDFDSDEEEEVRVVKTAEESFRSQLTDLVFGMMKDAEKYRIADAWSSNTRNA